MQLLVQDFRLGHASRPGLVDSLLRRPTAGLPVPYDPRGHPLHAPAKQVFVTINLLNWRHGWPARCFRHRDSGDRRARLRRPRHVVRRALAARSLSRRDRFERAVHTATTSSSYQHYAPDRGRAVLSAVLPIPRHRRGGVRARCPSEHSQPPLLGFRGGPEVGVVPRRGGFLSRLTNPASLPH